MHKVLFIGFLISVLFLAGAFKVLAESLGLIATDDPVDQWVGWLMVVLTLSPVLIAWENRRNKEKKQLEEEYSKPITERHAYKARSLTGEHGTFVVDRQRMRPTPKPPLYGGELLFWVVVTVVCALGLLIVFENRPDDRPGALQVDPNASVEDGRALIPRAGDVD